MNYPFITPLLAEVAVARLQCTLLLTLSSDRDLSVETLHLRTTPILSGVSVNQSADTRYNVDSLGIHRSSRDAGLFMDLNLKV